MLHYFFKDIGIHLSPCLIINSDAFADSLDGELDESYGKNNKQSFIPYGMFKISGC